MSIIGLRRAGRRAMGGAGLLAVAAVLVLALPARSAGAPPPSATTTDAAAVSQAPARLLSDATGPVLAVPSRAAKVSTTDAVDEGDLPTTGTKIGVFAGLGALVLVAGVALLVFARRREDSDIE